MRPLKMARPHPHPHPHPRPHPRPHPHPRPRRARRLAPALCMGVLFACSGGNGTTAPPDEPPTITVQGVEDGATYDAPVTVTITVSAGSYAARLNDEPFSSGSTVSEPGEYTLVVNASDGLATATERVDFAIEATGAGTSVLIIRMIDLGDAEFGGGGGDAILLTDSSAFGMQHALVDAGPGEGAGDDGLFVLQRLQALGVDTLEFLQLTHAHSDHFDGMDEVLQQIHVERFVYNGQFRSLSFYNDVIAAAEAHAETVIELDALLELTLGHGEARTDVAMLPPLPTYLNDPNAGSSEINEGSLATRVDRGFFSMFFTGDSEVEANQRWRTGFSAYSAGIDVLKVGHHGANNAVSAAWLNHTDPDIGIISSNGRSHPRIGALGLLSTHGIQVYCTSTHGDIVIRVDAGGSYSVQVEGDAGASCEAGTEADS